MNHLRSLLALLIVLLPFGTYAQGIAEYNREQPYIEVVGKAEKEISPDEIFIAITLRERLEGREKISVQKQEEELLTALRTLGIGADQLKLSGANARYTKVGWNKKDVMAKADYLLLVSTAQMAARVFEQLDKINISEAHISHLSHSRIEEFKKEVRIEAIKAAKAKADYLLASIGERVGKPLIVTESDPHKVFQPSNVANFISTVGYPESPSSKGEIALNFEKIKIDASVYVKFSIL